jgi:hypothetical protein
VEFAAFYAKRAAASLWKTRFDFGARTETILADMSGGYLPYVLPALYTEIVAGFCR